MSGILNPLASLTLPLLALLLVLVAIQNRKREDRRRKLGLITSQSAFKLTFLTALPLALMGLALFRPYAGSTDVTVPASSDDYMFVVDVSRSMFAKDVPPSRIDLAKRKMKDLIDEFTKEGEPHRYGITLFAGYSYLLCPITDDTSVVKQFISEISPEMVTSLGSNLEAGVSTALGRFTEETSRNARLLLVSDGEDDQLTLNRVSDLMKGRKIRVDVLGVGTTMGSPIELDDGSFVRNSSGAVVHSKLGEESLKAIADAGSGIYVRATVDDRDIRELAKASLSPRRGANQGTRTVRTYDEFGSWLALAALGALLTFAAFPRAGTLLRSVFVLLAFSNSAFAIPHSSTTARAAYELYSEGKFKEAAAAFKAALDGAPNDRALRQSYASALFKGGNYEEARQIFNALASEATSGRDYFENTYNEGNALLALKRYQEAVDAFTKALDVKPEDERALHNKKIAKALLDEKKNKPTPTPTPTRDPNQSPQPSPSPQSSSKPEQNDKEEQQDQKQQQDSPSPSPASSPEGSPSPGAASSPDSSASPSPNPSASPQGQPDGSPSPDPSAAPSPQPSPSEGSPTAQAEEDKKKEEDTRPKENQDEEPPPQEQNASSKPLALDTRSPSQKEADAWLESLPESPLLIRKERGRRGTGGQTW